MVDDISKKKAWFIQCFLRTYEIRLFQIGKNKKVIMLMRIKKISKGELDKKIKIF